MNSRLESNGAESLIPDKVGSDIEKLLLKNGVNDKSTFAETTKTYRITEARLILLVLKILALVEEMETREEQEKEKERKEGNAK